MIYISLFTDSISSIERFGDFSWWEEIQELYCCETVRSEPVVLILLSEFPCFFSESRGGMVDFVVVEKITSGTKVLFGVQLQLHWVQLFMQKKIVWDTNLLG